MAFFLLASVMALGTLGILAAGVYLRQPRESTRSGAREVTIYKDQLAEIERDLARGTITVAEENAARLEIERRLLVAARREKRKASPAAHRRLALVTVVMIGLLPASAGLLYLALGQPSMTTPDTTREDAREILDIISQRPASGDVIRRLTSELQADMDNAGSWLQLGRALYANGRKAESLTAYETALNLSQGQDERLSAEYLAVLTEALEARVAEEPDDIDAWSRLADLRMTLGDIEGGQAAYEQVLRIDPTDQAARGALGIDAFTRRN